MNGDYLNDLNTRPKLARIKAAKEIESVDPMNKRRLT